MPNPHKTKPDEASEFYQIRIQPALKEEFMRNCHDQALNPSAVVRMLMDEWNQKNETKKESHTPIYAAKPQRLSAHVHLP